MLLQYSLLGETDGLEQTPPEPATASGTVCLSAGTLGDRGRGWGQREGLVPGGQLELPESERDLGTGQCKCHTAWESPVIAIAPGISSQASIQTLNSDRDLKGAKGGGGWEGGQ